MLTTQGNGYVVQSNGDLGKYKKGLHEKALESLFTAVFLNFFDDVGG